MKIKHIWSVLCRESIINQDDNNISINGVIEELSIFLSPQNVSEKLPAEFGVPISYEIVSTWFKDADVDLVKAVIEYVFKDPDKKVLLTKQQEIEIPKTAKRHRTRMKIIGMPLTKDGEYLYEVKIKEEGSERLQLVAEIPIDIKINIQPHTEAKKAHK